MGVSFTLKGLNTQLSLIRKAGYPVHIAQDICGSYYIDLDMSANLFDNIFWFKTTNPDLVDGLSINVYLIYLHQIYGLLVKIYMINGLARATPLILILI